MRVRRPTSQRRCSMNIDKRTLREVAEKATPGPWKVFSDIDTKTFSIHTPRDKRCENVIKWGGFDCQPNAEANAEFIAAFNPKVALALLDELEHYKSREERVTKLVLDNSTSWDALYKKLEAAEKRIAEQREYYEGVIADGSKRIAELESKNDNLRAVAHEQNELAIRASLDSNNATVEIGRLQKRIAELEARTVTVKLYDDFQLCHYGATDDYAKGYIDCQNIFTKWLAAAGIKVKGE